MLDSGASTSLVYEGESLVGYIPRTVPHIVALFLPRKNCLSDRYSIEEKPLLILGQHLKSQEFLSFHPLK